MVYCINTCVFINNEERSESVRGIQSKVRAGILILACILSLSLLFSTGSGIVIQYNPTENTHQDSFSSGGIGRVHQNPFADICIQQTTYIQEAQQLLRLKNNNCMEAFYGSSDGLFCDTDARFVSLSDQIPEFRINYFLISPNSPNAPPSMLVKAV